MTFKPARLLLALIAVASAPAFAQNLAVVNGKAIPSARADEIVKQLVAQGRAQGDTPDLRAMIKEDLITREVLMQEAVKLGFDKKADVREAIETTRQSIMVNTLARDYLTKNPVTDAEIKAEYDKSKAEVGTTEYHVRHILLTSEADAKAVIAKLKAGSKFEELAKQSKDTGTANNGGDLEWAPPSSFPAEFGAAVGSLKKGSYTETPVRTPAGFHVIKVEDTRPITFPSLDQVKPQISEGMVQQKLRAYQEQMVKKAKVQ